MANISHEHWLLFVRKLYPAFSRRATQVCILSSAMEKIESGDAPDPRALARAALEEANPFGWKERTSNRKD